MAKERFNSIIAAVRKFIFTDAYFLCLILLAAVFIFTDKCVYGVVTMALLLAAVMALTGDLVPVIEGVMVIACFAIKLKYSTRDFLKLWPLGIPLAILFFSHFILYRQKLRRPGTFWGMAAVSLALILGGAGIINPRSYFSPTSLFYITMLGIGNLLICCYLAENLAQKKEYDLEERFCKLMLSPVIIIAFMLFYEYFTRRAELHGAIAVLPFQWRNNGSTLLMLSMPFVFYFSKKHFGFFLLGLFCYGEILLTGSRGGLLFGAAELAICVTVMIIKDKKHRTAMLITAGVCVVILLIAGRQLADTIRYTITRLLDPGQNSQRLELYARGLSDFKSSPLVGRGIGYMGNRDIHPNAKHTLCWYHNSFVQAAASCGITGLAAYAFLNFQRVRVYIRNRSFFSLTMFLSFIGLEMMSLVNPGIFVPFPYLALVSLYFAIMEINKENSQ